jgi:hypothetical protein
MMRKSDDPGLRDYDDDIPKVLRNEGGYHSIGVRASAGCDWEPIKARCTIASAPLIDSRMLAFEEVVRLAVRGLNGWRSAKVRGRSLTMRAADSLRVRVWPGRP